MSGCVVIKDKVFSTQFGSWLGFGRGVAQTEILGTCNRNTLLIYHRYYIFKCVLPKVPTQVLWKQLEQWVNKITL